MKSARVIFTPSDSQRKWLDDEKSRTGINIANLLRGLIQSEIDLKNGVKHEDM